MPLPLIRNLKTVDPSDKSSTKVVQIETAMGSAVNVFPGARVIEVERKRFLPVKTTNDLMLLRSDVYEITEQQHLIARKPAPLVQLDDHYKLIADFEARTPSGPPSLLGADSLTVRGDWIFGADVVATGDAHLVAPGEGAHAVPDGAHIGPDGLA
ncbi:hypothetical protein GCM10025875_12350 [Litorihabitans aurantiacus]|uniref:Uncharacterized protein n=1 Tax=Litorihabitans aurantiacus TaxID=1930061 RepID=A0AA37XDI5_9MICO|nr:hypothetical protein GCM10025875_12350 [Litorihabitans aurantiacus]